MALPDSYTQKPTAIPAYFEAILDAEAPERFTQSFLENLEFKSTNDRLFIKILKDLRFLDADAVPTDRYFEFLDRSRSQRVVAEGIREAYADLFAVNIKAHELAVAEVKNKLRTLYKGAKTDLVIDRISSTFVALCEYADFTGPARSGKDRGEVVDEQDADEDGDRTDAVNGSPPAPGSLSLGALQYHFNIVLPESRDQAVYDAIFKSLRDHLGASEWTSCTRSFIAAC